MSQNPDPLKVAVPGDGPSPSSPWWLPGAHAQTLWRKLVRPPALERRRERVELEDGDFIDLDHCRADAAGADERPLVLILHGLCGCSRSPYVLSLQALLQRMGLHSVAMNLRGCSGEPNRLARAYHSGCSEDLEAVAAHLLAARPRRRLALVGHSLGANLLIKWLAESALVSRVTTAVAVSSPFDLASCCRQMVHGGLSRFYGSYFLGCLRAEVARKKRHFEAVGRHEELARLEALGSLETVTDLWQFDDRVTAPLHGFVDARDYYRRCSSARFLPWVTVPTLIIQARNDPVVPFACVPPTSEAADCVEWAVSNRGGHVGFAARGCLHWLEHRIAGHIVEAG